MLTPNYVNLRYWFYPIGNTPAVNVFRDGSYCTVQDDEQQIVRVLFLACGDPRSLLYSVWCQEKHESKDSSLNFDFTCCDMDPAVLARNVVLFSLIADYSEGADLSTHAAAIWNIFYHFYIPQDDLRLLQSQAKKLLEASESSHTWFSSSYGKFIQMMNEDTLLQMREFWTIYAGPTKLADGQTQDRELRVRAAIVTLHKEKIGNNAVVHHGLRSVGVHWAKATQAMPIAFKGFWETGVVGANRRDVDALSNDGKGRVNSMLSTSSAPSKDFAVHYGSDPLLGFHLAEAFDKETGSKELVHGMVRLAKSQFRSWCLSLASQIASDRVQIRLFCGEAVRFCHELRSRHYPAGSINEISRLYASPWRPNPLVLDERAESSGSKLFDVIDTSNLIDHVGLLNVLPAVSSLLRRAMTSVLYTESLLLASDDITSSLRGLLCSDITTTALILGLAPMGHLVGFTTDAVGCEATLLELSLSSRAPGHLQQYRMRIPWRIPNSGDIEALRMQETRPHDNLLVKFDANELANHFFKMYLEMFSSEDLKLASGMGLASLVREIKTPLAKDLRYYTRLSLVVLLHLAKMNISTDWPKCVELLLEKVESDRNLIVGTNSLQELYLHLHLFGIWQNPSLSRCPREIVSPYGEIRQPSHDKGMLAQEELPSVLYVALVVPRKKLEVFTNKPPDVVGTPGLHCSLIHHDLQFDNSFFATQSYFGRLISTSDDRSTCEVKEDSHGWSGSADLIVTCPVPAYMLLLGPRDGLHFSLNVNSTPSTSQFVSQLGLRMVVFGCGLDNKRLWVLRDAPGLNNGQSSSHNIEQTLPTKPAGVTHVSLNAESEAKTAQIHTSIPKESPEGKLLAGGAKVDVTQCSPCTLRLTISNETARLLVYQFPVDGSQNKIRVARKSSWVEVQATFAPALTSSGYNGNPFPVLHNGSHPITWSMPYVNLTGLPNIPINESDQWLTVHMGMALSQRERDLVDGQGISRPANGLLDLKESLNLIFQSFAGRNPKCGPMRCFLLQPKDRAGGVDGLLFASATLHDHDAGSILLDAYIVQLTQSRVKDVLPALSGLTKTNPLTILVSEEESVLWKNLTPALAERCRFTWSHKASCEYRRTGRVPLSTAYGEASLCSCGEGQASETFPSRKEYRPFMKYATRIAISPISAVNYIEKFLSEKMKRDTEALSTSVGRQPASSGSRSGLSTTTPTCQHCGRTSGNLKACARCQAVRYCNHECQKAAWKAHKKICGTN
ncbi:MAG: hypothetical protein M1837_003667 [Sclerophora amabilis]|nr:MAG: hypothetical protein M1837_003667 [Sclerophora amabilis]